MRYNLSRHFLLKKMAEKLNSVDNNKRQIEASLVGLTLQEIDNYLKRDETERELILSGLGEAKEIEAFHDHLDRVAGYFITDNIGLNSFVEKKYLNKNNDIVLNWLKNIVQLFIPIASLAVAILALSLKLNSQEKNTNQKFQTLKREIEMLNKKIDDLENKVKKNDIVNPDASNYPQR